MSEIEQKSKSQNLDALNKVPCPFDEVSLLDFYAMKISNFGFLGGIYRNFNLFIYHSTIISGFSEIGAVLMQLWTSSTTVSAIFLSILLGFKMWSMCFTRS